MKKIISTLLFTIGVFVINISAWAFMPVIGLWNIDAEMNGQPGRGFMIETRNEIVFMTYFGYRSDGSSLKYNAIGPLINNNFTADLVEYQGGTVIGGMYQPASMNGTIGPVTLSFTSGTHGTITLPGDTPRAISKNSFGYSDGPDGLLGKWLITYDVLSYPNSAIRTLTTNLGVATSTGNGVVATSTGNFGCEFQVSGSYTGMVFCVDVPQAVYSDFYVFKLSGDRGTGVGGWWTSATTLSPLYEAHALRVATKTGAKTGLNDGTIEFIQAQSVMGGSGSNSLPVPVNENVLKVTFSEVMQNISPEDFAKSAAVASWAAEVRAIIPSIR